MPTSHRRTAASNALSTPPWPPNLPADPAQALIRITPHLPAGVAEHIRRYQPSPEPATWKQVAALVRVGLAGYLPLNIKRVQDVGRIVVGHVCACHARGADLSLPGVWSSAQVEHTLASGTGGWSERSRTTMAAPLRRISANLVPLGQPLRPVRYHRFPAPGPYPSGDLAGLVETATMLESAKWRGRASLLLALTAGAGLTDADLRLLTADSLLPTHPVRVVVPDTTGRGRTVPVFRDFAPLAVAAHTLMLTRDPRLTRPDTVAPTPLFANREVTSRLFEQLAWPHGTRPTGQRLRATWSGLLLASGCGLPAYLRAAHIVSIDTWYTAVAHLEELPEDDYLAQARGDSHLHRLPPALGAGLALDGSPWPSPHVPLRASSTGSAGRTGRRGGRR